MPEQTLKVSQLPTAGSINTSDEVVVNHNGETSKAPLQAVLEGTGVAGHMSNPQIHAPINDAGVADNQVWSSQKVVDYITTLLGSSDNNALPVNRGGTGITSIDANSLIYSPQANALAELKLANTLQISNNTLSVNIDELRQQLGGNINVGFQPAALSVPLVLWLDAAKGVTQTGGAVERWKNLAPTGEPYDAVQSNEDYQPGFSGSAGPNGYPGITFDGTLNQKLELLSGGLDIAKNVPGLTFCVVMNPDYPVSPDDDPGTVFFISEGADVNEPRFSYTVNNSPSGQRVAQIIAQDGGTWAGIYESNVPTEAACWDTITVDFQNDLASIYSDGLELRHPHTFTSTGNTSNTASLGVKIGSMPNGAYVFSGAISEILVWQGELTAEERTELDRYVNAKHFNFNTPNVDYFIYVGDSNIYGLGIDEEDRIHSQVEELLTPISGVSFKSFNWGVGGLKVSDSLSYYETNYKISNLFLPNARKKYLIFGSGTGDVLASNTVGTIIANYRMFIDFYKSAGFIVLPWTTLPLSDSGQNTVVNNLNTNMQTNYESYGWQGLIEANSAVVDPPSSDFQGDNYNLTAAGITKVANEVVETIEGVSNTATFFDDFNDDTFDPTKWSPYFYWGDTPAYNPGTGEIQDYDEDQLSFSDSKVIMTATKTVSASTDTGAISPATFASTFGPDGGSVAWADPGNAASSNNLYTVASRSNAGTSHYLMATNLGLNIPKAARILGYKFEIECKQSLASAFRVEQAFVIYNGSGVSDDFAASPIAVGYGTPAIPTTEGYITFGGSTVLGNCNLNPVQINDPTFGFAFMVRRPSGSGTQTVSVDHIRVTVYYEPITYKSAMLSGQGKFSQTYGYFEASLKVPTGNGYWPAFWLLRDDEPTQWPPEIDIVEIGGADPTKAQMTVHFDNAGVPDGVGEEVDIGEDLSDDFHVYAIDWRAGYIRWYIDGVQVFEFTDAAKIPNVPMYMIINLALGSGGWAAIGRPDGTTTFPQALEVEYVRVKP